MAGATVTNQAVLDALNALRVDFRESTGRLETKIDALDCRINDVERGSGRDAVSTENIKKEVDDHEQRIRELEKLAPAMRVVIWIAGALGLSVVALIWSLITGQASLIFK
jgi:uncharacterized protein YhaN